MHVSVEGPDFKCSLKCNQSVTLTCHFPRILHLMDLKDLLSDLIAGGFIQKCYVFIQKPHAFSEFPILSHYFIKSVPLDWDLFF